LGGGKEITSKPRPKTFSREKLKAETLLEKEEGTGVPVLGGERNYWPQSRMRIKATMSANPQVTVLFRRGAKLERGGASVVTSTPGIKDQPLPEQKKHM